MFLMETILQPQGEHALKASNSQLEGNLIKFNRIRDLRELAIPPGNRLEGLKGTRLGQYSIRINDQFRICFYWENGNAHEVEITDYH